jgi:hypothetical protein
VEAKQSNTRRMKQRNKEKQEELLARCRNILYHHPRFVLRRGANQFRYKNNPRFDRLYMD